MLTDAGDDEACSLAVRAKSTLHSADITHVALCYIEVGGNDRLRDAFGEEEFGQFRWSACDCQVRVSGDFCDPQRVMSNRPCSAEVAGVQCANQSCCAACSCCSKESDERPAGFYGWGLHGRGVEEA